jgi:hypothetical protein
MIGSLLFWAKGRSDGASLSDVINASSGSLAAKTVASFDKGAFAKHTDDELAAIAATKLKIEPLTLHRANSTSTLTEKKIESTNHFGETGYIDGVEVITKVPFTGESELFELKPSQHDLSPPHGRVSGKELIVGVAVSAREKDSAIAIIKNTLDSVERYISNQKSQIDSFNSDIEAIVKPLVAARRADLASQDDLLSRLNGI